MVALDGLHMSMPDIDIAPPNSGNLRVYHNSSSFELVDRIKDATIVITTAVALDAAILDPAVTPKLQHVAVLASGTDHVDLEACRKRGITVTNTPSASVQSVAQHGVSLYFAARRKTVLLHNTVADSSEWKRSGSIVKRLKTPDGDTPLLCQEEVCGIVGYGHLGKQTETIAKNLGMKVLVAERKAVSGFPTASMDGNAARVPFVEVIRESTVIFLTLPKTPETVNLISTKELNEMSPKAVIVNVARGGLVDETAVVAALKEGRIAGYATDVLMVEPADGATDTPLLGENAKCLNITVSPHVAWCAGWTLKNLQRMVKENIENWAAGKPRNVVVPGDS